MISVAIFAFSSDTAFPGAAAAIPTLGTALVIQAGIGGGSIVASLLSLRPVVFIGLISYSLYLWHWPIIVYTRLCSITEPGTLAICRFDLVVCRNPIPQTPAAGREEGADRWIFRSAAGDVLQWHGARG